MMRKQCFAEVNDRIARIFPLRTLLFLTTKKPPKRVFPKERLMTYRMEWLNIPPGRIAKKGLNHIECCS